MKISLAIAVILVLAMAIVGCDFVDLFTSLSPPEWIMGTWSDDIGVMSWTFTSDNATYSIGYLTLDFKEMHKSRGVSVADKPTNTSYMLMVTENRQDAGTYALEKASEMTLNFKLSISGVTMFQHILQKK